MRDASICGLGQTALQRDRARRSAGSGCSRKEQRERRADRTEAHGRARGRRAIGAVFEGETTSVLAAALGSTRRRSATASTLEPANACRVCVVEVEGSCVLAPACSRKVEAGHEGTDRFRARSPLAASSCSSCSLPRATSRRPRRRSGYLERYAARAGALRAADRARPRPRPQADRSSRRAGRPDGSDGVRPVKVDNELSCSTTRSASSVTNASTRAASSTRTGLRSHVAGRGFDARISTEYVAELPESACVYCGNCIAAADRSADVPLRARAAGGRALAEDEQTVTTTICPYCGVGCNLELHVQDNRSSRSRARTTTTSRAATSASRAVSGSSTSRPRERSG